MRIIVAILLAMITMPEVQAQVRTVGDGTLFVFQPGKTESYGIRDTTTGDTGFSSRHQRWGQSTGIGDSSIGTTSATVESRRSTFTVPSQDSPSLVRASAEVNGINSSPAFSAILEERPSWETGIRYRAEGNKPAGLTPIESLPTFSFKKRNIVLPSSFEL